MADLSNDELRAIELIAQLAALSPEGDPTSVRITARLGDGRLIGEALLSAKAVEALTDATISLNAYQEDQEAGGLLADPLPEVDADDVDVLVAELQNMLNGGQN
ncbi:hypothetical protein [Streptomyces sp. NPDC005548]|uniref:hypothetical protein n=1 Tax=Streptomyces sp. NPDC005548 TaxID=3364724 RepID=UPI0036CEAA8E